MILEKHLRTLYAEVIQSYQRTPNEAEFKAWTEVLGTFTFADVEAAIRRWRNDTLVEFQTQRPRGARIPTPAELKVSIESFDKANSEHFVPCNKCEGGWIRIAEGKTDKGYAVNKSVGAVKRCECFFNWARARKKA